jgi:hypothetical protein
MGPAAQSGARELRILRGQTHSVVMPLVLSLRPSGPARLMLRRCATEIGGRQTVQLGTFLAA